MKQVIIEYAGAVIAVLGAVAFLILLGGFFLGRAGLFARLIVMVLGGL